MKWKPEETGRRAREVKKENLAIGHHKTKVRGGHGKSGQPSYSLSLWEKEVKD